MAFGASTEDWRGLVASQAGQLNTSAGDQTEFLLAWTSKESNGYPCDTTSLGEIGISQLMPPDNLNAAGVSASSQHPVGPCVAGKTTYARYADLTSDQQAAQVQGLIGFANYCIGVVRDALAAVGTTWDETQPDFWKLVKGVHVSPVMVKTGLQRATTSLGRAPATWDEYAAANAASYPASWLANASAVGAYGGGAPSPSLVDYYNVVVNTDGATPPLSATEWILIGVVTIGSIWGGLKAAKKLYGNRATMAL